MFFMDFSFHGEDGCFGAYSWLGMKAKVAKSQEKCHSSLNVEKFGSFALGNGAQPPLGNHIEHRTSP